MEKLSMTILTEEPREEFKTKILIVDDEPHVLGMLKEAITMIGHTCMAVDSGEKAVELLEKEGNFTIVLTDMSMPKMDGMQLLKYVKNSFPRTDVVIVSGHTELYNYTEVIKAGASDFISKPFVIDELEAKLNRIIREQRLIRKLEHLSMCDVLTDLYNRRCFDVKLHEEIPRAHRQGYPVFLALVDVDRFKAYNDKLGHQAGDQVLRYIGDTLKSCTRENVDWCFRFGGDEFAIILPYTNMEQAAQIARRIIDHYREAELADTSLSAGVAQFVRHPGRTWTEDIDDLISRADRALYKAKAQGGNTVIYDTSVPLP